MENIENKEQTIRREFPPKTLLPEHLAALPNTSEFNLTKLVAVMAAHTSSKIHIAINGPSGATFPSFASTDLAGGNLQKIFLSNIRNKCNM